MVTFDEIITTDAAHSYYDRTGTTFINRRPIAFQLTYDNNFTCTFSNHCYLRPLPAAVRRVRRLDRSLPAVSALFF